MVLRRKEPHLERPYRVIGYPVTPLLFAGVCVFLIHAAVIYKPGIAAAAAGLLLLGLGVWWRSTWPRGGRSPGRRNHR